MHGVIQAHSYITDMQISASESLIKHSLASQLRAEIMGGSLLPGERIVEGTWSRHFGVAQGSIREAINILAHEGFVTKTSGRSARVVNLNEDDVIHLYAVRGALEGLAARTAASLRVDPAKLKLALVGMRAAAGDGRKEALLDQDLEFHLELCRLSANPFLIAHAARILLPFFAFIRIRLITAKKGVEIWQRDLESHQKIIDLIIEGDGEIAELYVRKSMTRFATAVFNAWRRDKGPAQ